jgi:radical SAM protein with 4Fe4S-binding SPASM domain
MFKQIMDELPDVPETLVLYHGGEPLLNSALKYLVKHAKEKGVKKVVFNTNASLLTVQKALDLSACGLDEMRVSFDGSSPEQNDKIRRGSNFWRHAPIVKQAAGFLKVVIYNVKFDGDLKTAQYLRDYFGNEVGYRTDLARVWAHEDKDSEPKTGAVYCRELNETFSILSDGNVVSCCEDLMGDYIYGNVFKEPPLQIWNRMQELRDRFMDKDYPELCKHCYIVTGKRLDVKN